MLACKARERLEAEFYHALQDAVADLIRCVSELWVQRSARVKSEVQARVIGDEGPIRVVEEVVSRDAELQFSALGEGEILEYREVTIPKARAGEGRKDVVALLARRGEWRKAGAIDVLVGLERTSGITGQRGRNRDVSCSKYVIAASWEAVRVYYTCRVGIGESLAHKRRTGFNKAGIAKVRANRGLQIHTGLVLRDAGDLPPI